MAANHQQTQPLLQDPSSPHNQRRRFRRRRNGPSGPPPQAQKGPKLSLVAGLTGLYLAVATGCFFLVRDQIAGPKTQALVDSLYFCVVTVTTVGYGDLVPVGAAAKLLACAFVFLGMGLVGFLLGRAADYFVEKQEAFLARALSLPGKEVAVDKARYKFWTCSGLQVILMGLGMGFLWKVEGLGPIDAFYGVCSTVTTLGYGDESFSTVWGRLFAVVWILISTVCLAQLFLYLAEWKAERNQWKLAQWVLDRRLTYVDLQAADFDHDGAVGAAEFIIYKLKEMGKISEEDIALVMEGFEDLDVDHSGTLTARDLPRGWR